MDNSRSSPLRTSAVQERSAIYHQDNTSLNISSHLNPQPQVDQQAVSRKLDFSVSFSGVNQSSSFYDKNSLLYKARQETVQTLVDQICLEKEIDDLKKRFNECQEFSVFAAIQTFDAKGRGSVSLSEFQEVCQELLAPSISPYHLNSQTYQIFRRYDRDCDGYLSFSEFSDFLMPTSDGRIANAIQVRRDARLSADAIDLIKRVLQAHISANGSHEFLRSQFRKSLERQYLTLNDAFRSLDTHERGFLSAYDLQDYLAENRRGCVPSELASEVDLLLSLYDKRNVLVT